MYENHIADITLAPEGEKKIRWAAGHKIGRAHV